MKIRLALDAESLTIDDLIYFEDVGIQNFNLSKAHDLKGFVARFIRDDNGERFSEEQAQVEAGKLTLKELVTVVTTLKESVASLTDAAIPPPNGSGAS